MFSTLLAAFVIFLGAIAPPQHEEKLPFAGIWELKTVTVNGHAATKAEMTTLLKEFGGVEAGMTYKFRANSFGSINGFGVYCQYFPETKEMVVVSDQEGNDKPQQFDVRFADKTLRLTFKDGTRKVSMTFAPGD